MDQPPPGRPLLADMLRQIDEARNASPHPPQQISDIVRERNERLASQAEKIQALRRAREARPAIIQGPEGEWMARKRELIDTDADQGMCVATSAARRSLNPMMSAGPWPRIGGSVPRPKANPA
jgi:hypothetical protein